MFVFVVATCQLLVMAQRLTPTPSPWIIRLPPTPPPSVASTLGTFRSLPTFIGATTTTTTSATAAGTTTAQTPAPTPAPDPVLTLIGADSVVGQLYPGSLVKFDLKPFPPVVRACVCRVRSFSTRRYVRVFHTMPRVCCAFCCALSNRCFRRCSCARLSAASSVRCSSRQWSPTGQCALAYARCVSLAVCEAYVSLFVCMSRGRRSSPSTTLGSNEVNKLIFEIN